MLSVSRPRDCYLYFALGLASGIFVGVFALYRLQRSPYVRRFVRRNNYLLRRFGRTSTTGTSDITSSTSTSSSTVSSPVISMEPITEDLKMVLVVRTDLQMGRGKIAAQCAHAAVANFFEASERAPHLLAAWTEQGQPKIVLRVDNEAELDRLETSANSAGLIAESICDAGLTQIAAGSKTVLGIGPSQKSLIDKITGHLKLLN